MECSKALSSTFRQAIRLVAAARPGPAVWLVCGLSLILAAPVVAQSKEPVSWFETELTIDLADPASSIVAGDLGRALIVSAATQTAALLDVAKGGIVGKADLPGTPVSAAAGSGLDGLGNYAVITRTTDGFFRLTTLSASADGLQGRERSPMAVPGDFLTPNVIYLPQPATKSIGGTALLVWDADPNQQTYSYQMAFNDYSTSIVSKDYPRQFLGIGSGLSVITLQSDARVIEIGQHQRGSGLASPHRRCRRQASHY